MEIVTRPIEAIQRSPGVLKKKVFRRAGALKKRALDLSNDWAETSSSRSLRSTASSRELRASECLEELKDYFKRSSSFSVSKDVILRFAIFHSFQYEEALKAIQDNHDSRLMKLRMSGFLLRQFKTMTLFPLPGLKTKDRKSNVFYMRPSRYEPSSSEVKTSSHMIIDNLCYVLNDLSRTKEQCQNGVTFIANMNDFTMKNFSQDYCFQFMEALQGKMVPTTVKLFLIVNPPTWFDDEVWSIMKPMLSRSFAKRVRMINEDRLGEFLMDGYEQYLPDEFACGYAQTEEICEDYIDLRRYEDKQNETRKSQ